MMYKKFIRFESLNVYCEISVLMPKLKPHHPFLHVGIQEHGCKPDLIIGMPHTPLQLCWVFCSACTGMRKDEKRQ